MRFNLGGVKESFKMLSFLLELLVSVEATYCVNPEVYSIWEQVCWIVLNSLCTSYLSHA